MGKKYLIGDDDGKLYTVNAEQELTQVQGNLSAALFEAWGMDAVPPDEVLRDFANPSVYCWKSTGTPHLTAVVTALPKPQVIYSENIDMSDKTIIGIENVIIDGDDNTLYAVSADNGSTWWNYVNSAWVQLSEDTSGQTREDIEAISTSAWAEFAITGSIKFRFVLATASNYVREIRINYLNTTQGVSAQKILQSIMVKSPPNKQIYALGEAFDLTGVSIIADYDNGTRANVTSGCQYSISDGEPLVTAGVQDVTVSYAEGKIVKTAIFEINVKEE